MSKTDKIAARIANFIITIQTKVSNYMNKKLVRMSLKKTKIFLTIFCLFWGGFSLYLVIRAVTDKKPAVLKIDPVNLPHHFNNEEKKTDQVDRNILRQISDYKRFMDSIHQPIRPGLMDSMTILEKIYLSQQKNEAYEK